MNPYLIVVILFFIVLAVGVTILLLTHLIGPRVKNEVKLGPYESGKDIFMDARSRVSIKYFLIALMFIIFDIEVVFMYPWAVVYKDLLPVGRFIFYEMLFFILVLLFGYVYVWRKGAFQWE